MMYLIIIVDLFMCIVRAIFFTILHFLYDFKYHKRYCQTEKIRFKETLNRF